MGTNEREAYAGENVNSPAKAGSTSPHPPAAPALRPILGFKCEHAVKQFVDVEETLARLRAWSAHAGNSGHRAYRAAPPSPTSTNGAQKVGSGAVSSTSV
jgi:hypothetical protein